MHAKRGSPAKIGAALLTVTETTGFDESSFVDSGLDQIGSIEACLPGISVGGRRMADSFRGEVDNGTIVGPLIVLAGEWEIGS